MRHSVRLVLQQVLEDEVTTWLGRDWNVRGDRERVGQRNGHSDLTIKTTAGPVSLKRPKLRNTTERYASQLLGKGVVRSEPLEALVISSWVRGLSDRDIEALLGEALGPEAALSRSTASRICARLKDDFEAFRNRDLSSIDLDYLFLDGSHFKMHDGTNAEPVLVAYGITTVGEPVLIAVEPAAAESTDAWADFLADLTRRGLKVPLLTITDGAAGLISAIGTELHGSLRQRCLIHRARNVLAKVPAEHQQAIKAEFWAIFDDIDTDPGQGAVDVAQRRIDAFADRHAEKLPAAVPLPARRPPSIDLVSAVPDRASQTDPSHQPHRTYLRRDPPTRQSHRPDARRSLMPRSGVGRTRPSIQRLARTALHPRHHPSAHRHPQPTQPTNNHPGEPHHRAWRHCHSRRVE